MDLPAFIGRRKELRRRPPFRWAPGSKGAWAPLTSVQGAGQRAGPNKAWPAGPDKFGGSCPDAPFGEAEGQVGDGTAAGITTKVAGGLSTPP